MEVCSPSTVVSRVRIFVALASQQHNLILTFTGNRIVNQFYKLRASGYSSCRYSSQPSSHRLTFGNCSVQTSAGLDKQEGDSQIILFLFAKHDFIEHLPYNENTCKDKYNVSLQYFTADSKVWGENFKQNSNLKSNI